MDRPDHGWSSACRIINVVDGDTVDVEITRRCRVRLIECWSPEVHGPEKAAGLAAKKNMMEMAFGQEGTLFVPTENTNSLSDILTLGRVLGRVWTDGRKPDLSTRQVQQGHATKDKVK